MIIYKTTNLINGKIYVGKDKKNNPEYLGSGILITKAFKKYGIENFKKETLETCLNKQHLNEREVYWIKLLNSTNKEIGYNITKGGDGGDIFNYLSEEGKLKQRLLASKTAQGSRHGFKTSKFLGVRKTKCGNFSVYFRYMKQVFKRTVIDELFAATIYDQLVVWKHGLDVERINFPALKQEYLLNQSNFIKWFVSPKPKNYKYRYICISKKDACNYEIKSLIYFNAFYPISKNRRKHFYSTCPTMAHERRKQWILENKIHCHPDFLI